MKVLIQSGSQNIIQEHKNYLQAVGSIVATLQQHVTNLKQENLNLKEKTREDLQDLEKHCEGNERMVDASI